MVDEAPHCASLPVAGLMLIMPTEGMKAAAVCRKADARQMHANVGANMTNVGANMIGVGRTVRHLGFIF